MVEKLHFYWSNKHTTKHISCFKSHTKIRVLLRQLNYLSSISSGPYNLREQSVLLHFDQVLAGHGGQYVCKALMIHD
jgi:hypothetical protein